MGDPSKKARLLRWQGEDKPYLDEPHITQIGHVTLGCYGGNTTAGAQKNEDAVMVLVAPDDKWTFSALCDAHCSSQSALLVLDVLESIKNDIVTCISAPITEAFATLESLVLETLFATSSAQGFAAVQGETALLLCAQRAQFLWWLSIGDNSIYLFHSDLARLGQYALNQRHFFEWVGKVNALALPVPCYSRGVSELRKGLNQIVLITDGVLEFGQRPYEDSRQLYTIFEARKIQGLSGQREAHEEVLQSIHAGVGRDSATIISFTIDMGSYDSSLPSS